MCDMTMRFEGATANGKVRIDMSHINGDLLELTPWDMTHSCATMYSTLRSQF